MPDSHKISIKSVDKSLPYNLKPSSERKLQQGIILTLLASLSLVSWALKPSDTPLEQRLQHQLSVDDIARQIKQQHHWRILAAEPTVEDEKTLYRFKLLNKKRGRVQVIVIDPKQPNLNRLK